MSEGLYSKLGIGGEAENVTHPKFTMGSAATSKELGVNADSSSGETVSNKKLGLKAGGHAMHKKECKKLAMGGLGTDQAEVVMPVMKKGGCAKKKMAMGGVGKIRLGQYDNSKISKAKMGDE